MDDADGTITALQQACESAKTQLGPHCSFRLRTLIGMILLEIGNLGNFGGEAALRAEFDPRQECEQGTAWTVDPR